MHDGGGDGDGDGGVGDVADGADQLLHLLALPLPLQLVEHNAHVHALWEKYDGGWCQQFIFTYHIGDIGEIENNNLVFSRQS